MRSLSASHRRKLGVFTVCALMCALALFCIAGCASQGENNATPPANTGSQAGSQSDDIAVLDLVADDDAFRAFAANSSCSVLNNASPVDATLAGDSVERFNSCYSPISLYLALSLVACGTEGDAQQQLMDILGVQSESELETLAKQTMEQLQDTYEGYDLALANSVWANEGFTFQESYLQTIANALDAEAFDAAFGSQEANDAISNWISENTDGLLTPQFQTSAQEVAILINTLYFKDAWLDSFKEDATADGTFHATKGDVTTPFMHATIDASSLGEGDNYTAAQLAFQGGATMSFYLPNEGVTPEDLTASPERTLELLNTEFDFAQVSWSVPKFTIDSSFRQLVNSMKALGLTDMFDPVNADAFAPMITSDAGADAAFYVSDIIQETHLALDEEGVEAAAFTAISVKSMAMMAEEDPIEFNLDRPFVYSIQSPEGIVLFMGIVQDPTM